MTNTHLEQALSDCRNRIDAIDVELQRLLERRLTVVEEVAGIKKQLGLTTFMRPMREGQIIRRLLERRTGNLQPQLLVNLWRELMMASLQQEQAFKAVVAAPLGSPLWTLARDHFGGLTPLAGGMDAAAALKTVTASGKHPVFAVLPDVANDPWWMRLKNTDLNIIFALPVLRAEAGFKGYVVGKLDPEPVPESVLLVIKQLDKGGRGELLSQYEGWGLYTYPASHRLGDVEQIVGRVMNIDK
jgi:chorismate mutase / prephenate dehydratase